MSPRGILGMGIASTTALAVLVFGCVFTAAAGPREALASQTQAVRQTLAATSPLTQAIVASSTWSQVSSSLAIANPGGPPDVNLTASQLGEITSQLHDDFNHGAVHLAAPDADWAGMTSSPHGVISSLPAADGVLVRLAVTCRQPFTQYTRLVAGRYPGVPATTSAPGSLAPVLQVVVSQQTASQFALHPGSTVRISGPKQALTGTVATITLDVTGIVVPRDPHSTFWTTDPVLLTPSLQTPHGAPPYWVGEVFAGPGEIDAVQRDFGPQGLAFQWEFPMVFGSLSGTAVQPLQDELSRLSTQSPALTGDVAPASTVLQVSTGLLPSVSAFLGAAQAVDTLLWLLYVSLAVAALVALLLAARMVAMRRSAELTICRARGASLSQISWATARGAAVACVPAAAVAVVLAVLLVPAARLGPGAEPVGGWWPAACTLLAAVCAPAAIAAWQQRLPRHRTRDRRRARGRTRLVAEATACLAAIAGIVVFRQQGTQAGAGVNLYTSAAPVLVAVPAAIIVLRVYPLVLRGLLRGYARRPGATAFLGLAQAARTALTPALPAFALVLALTVAAFAGMVRDAVARSEVAASWQIAGADVTITTAGQSSSGGSVTPAALRAVAAVPGVTHAAAVGQTTWTSLNGQQVTGVAVDPASYAALVAATQTFPQVPARQLTTGTPQPVLASAQAAADLGGQGAATLTAQGGLAPLRVRVTGLLSGTPAAPGVTAFMVMPVTAVHARGGGQIPLNELLLTGAHIDSARLSAVLRKVLPGAVVTDRLDILNGLTGAPLQHGTFALFGLAIAAAGALGLAVMLLELALGAAEREATLARLATMGLGGGQRVRIVALEVLPVLLAAAVAAGACALVLPRLVAPAIDLSVFTGSIASVALRPDVPSFALPLAGLAVVALVALQVQIRSGRRRGVAASLRAEG